MILPDAQTLYETIDRTWPAAEIVETEHWTMRFGAGGGSRVSSANAKGPVARGHIDAAARQMRDWEQSPLFMIRAGNDALDRELNDLGYVIKDPVTMYAAPVSALTLQRPPPVTSFEVWPPLACQKEIWAEGGIGSGRLAVMERAIEPKTTLLGRTEDTPCGTAFVGSHDGCAMIHALEIKRDMRRKGLARHLTIGAAFWAAEQGTEFLTLVTTTENAAANGLYSSLGMQVVGHYHYRTKP